MMGLPVVKTVSDCADFSKTVSPYIPQLYELPQQILQSITNLQELKVLYVSTNPLITAFALSLFLAPIFLFFSEINKNYSQVDRFWSILPTMYNAHYTLYAHAVGLPTQRLDTLLAASTVWSLRLSYNYWRKGGYSKGSEDYRWAILRQYISPALFFVFNVVFISFAQSILLFSVTMPTYIILLAARLTGNEFTTADLIFSRLLVGLVLLAFFADQQQWNFQSAKKTYQQTAQVPPKYTREDLDRGFNATGLWAWSRHPNFAAEQTVWVVLYQWACYVSHTYFNWTLAGPMAYLALFQGSTWLTEKISARKYPEYREYQARVGKFVPRLSTSLPGDFTGTSVGDAKAKAKAKANAKGEGSKEL